ncbi:hypothetical protein [Sphingobium sp. BHU LFT2]|nr:hypothetical protein [Sphingobium sp. BHU LFT2]
MPAWPNFTVTEGITSSPYFSTATTVDGKIHTPSFPVPVTFW